jgi:hypothetical protein
MTAHPCTNSTPSCVVQDAIGEEIDPAFQDAATVCINFEFIRLFLSFWSAARRESSLVSWDYS